MKAHTLSFILLSFVFAVEVSHAQTGEAEAFRELALRSLTYPGAPAEELTLFPNAVPEDFPARVSYPDSSHLIGTVQRPYETTVFISSEKSAADVMRYYYEYFRDAGWQTQEWPRWGFATAAEAFPNVYCKGDDGAWLNVVATEIAGRDTDVRLTANRHQGPTPCEQGAVERVGDFPPMPFLTVPERVRMTSTGSGGGVGAQPSEFQATAAFESARPVAELAQHFTAQLEASGWQQVDAGTNATTVWRTYRVHDEKAQSWMGQFFLTRLPGQDHVTAFVLVRQEGSAR